jgi:hypothetical protein
VYRPDNINFASERNEVMRVIVTDVLTSTCDLTGRKNVECLRVQLDEQSQEISCLPAELIKILRLRKKQSGPTPAATPGRRET